MSFKDKLAFFQHLITDKSSQEDVPKNAQPKQANKEDDNIQIQQQHKETKKEQEDNKINEDEVPKIEEKEQEKELEISKKDDEQNILQKNTETLLIDSQNILDFNEFPYFFIDKNASITESDLQISDLFIEEYRNSQNKHKLDVLQFNITLTNILNGKDNLLKIRSILIIFVFKNLIDISPYFPTLLTEDILLAEPKEELFSKDHKYFNPIFYNELKKHPLLMLNVIEVIKEFIQIHSLQFESIYPLIANIIRANEDSSRPLKLNQMNFFNANEINDKYKNQIIQNYPLILPFKFKYQEYINRKNVNKHIFVCANRKNILDAVWSLPSFKEKQFTLEVVFDDEPGVDSDHGGISREFIQLAFENIIEKETDLFELRNGFYWFKYHKDPSDDLLKKFKCVGILLAASILNGFNIPIRFPRYFYRKILNRNLVISDLAFFDPDLLKTVEYVQNNKISNTDNFEYTYYDQIDHYKVDLSNFRDVTGNENFKPKLITNDNKQSFVVKVNEWAFNTSVRHTFKAFHEGFQKVQLNHDFYDWFSLDEIDLIVSGDYEFNWNEFKSNTIYESPYNEKCEVINWFWNYFEKLDEDAKKNVLKFITGTSLIPPDGLESAKIKIVKSNRTLPTAHTCFKSLELPEYNSYDILKEKCDLAFPYSEGYGYF